MLGRISAAALAVISSVSPQFGPAVSKPSDVDVALTTTSTDSVAPSEAAAYVMGGMFVPTPGQNILDDIFNGYLQYNGITNAENVNALTTPEGFMAPTYQQGEQILDDAVKNASPGTTFVGYSESAGILGMFLRDHLTDVKTGDHFVAFAPPTMPGSGQFTWAMDPQHFWSQWFKLGTDPTFATDSDGSTPLDVNTQLPAGVTVDVFCGEYDPYCNTLPPLPEHPTWTQLWDSWLAANNQAAAGWVVHINYPSNGPAQFDNAVAITGVHNGVDFGDGGPGNIDFWMTPDQNPDVLPWFTWLTPLDWLDGNLSVRLSDVFRPAIDAAYVNSPLYDAMIAVEHAAGVTTTAIDSGAGAAESAAAAAGDAMSGI